MNVNPNVNLFRRYAVLFNLAEAMSGVNVPDEEGWMEVTPRKRRNRPKRYAQIPGNGNPNTPGNNHRGQSRGGARCGRGGNRGPRKNDVNSGGRLNGSGVQEQISR